MRVELGTPVRCKDAELGEVADIVIDPSARRVTHLVVQPWHGALLGARLVPVELVESDEAQQLVTLRCTREDFARLDSVRESAGDSPGGDFQTDDQEWDVGVVDVLAPPPPPAAEPATFFPSFPPQVVVSYDRIPKDEVELRQSSPVRSCDDRGLGHVEALVVDEQDRVTHFVLRHRRLLRARNVEIPVASIEQIGNDVVTLMLTRKQVSGLPTESPGRR